MKKVKITENELVSLIEKLVKENMGFGNGQNFGIMGTPTAKYQDLIEDEDIESPDELDEDNGEEEQLNLDVTSQPGSDNEDEWMEGVEESKLISRLKKRLNEDKDWMQKADADIEKRGTEGVFHKWCVDHGFKDGCSKGCWTAAKKAGSPWSRRAGLAKAYCESSH
jgi:hypothetical protein